MIRDRGNSKWTAMMLSEHVRELRKWMDQDNYTERPELNEWDLQSIQEELELAYKSQCETLIKTWESGRIIQHHGIVEDIDLRGLCIELKNPLGTEIIRVAAITNVQSLE
ncbi:YolD-like family protein [Sporosarcina sp. FSL K6-6792]|uniref:YolD-like family protein n=1 Tax=Sporosarcina sp. FSL K6-6792 TaxID=2921559 RepID=UPI0030F78ED8